MKLLLIYKEYLNSDWLISYNSNMNLTQKQAKNVYIIYFYSQIDVKMR